MGPRIILYVTFLLIWLIGNAKTLVSESTDDPIIYASIGVINRNFGTVTDTLGNFSLEIPSAYLNDSIRISSVGYKTKTIAVKDFESYPDTIRLVEDVIMLGNVVVKPQRIKHKTAGRKGGGGFVYIQVEGYKAAGQGLAIPLKVKERVWLKEIGFFIVENSQTLSHMKFRVNIYRKEGRDYNLQNLRPVYFEYDRTQLENSSFKYIFPEEIVLEHGDYYVELEFLENFFNESFYMASKPMTGLTRYRYASQSEWETIPFGSPIYVDYDCVE